MPAQQPVRSSLLFSPVHSPASPSIPIGTAGSSPSDSQDSATTTGQSQPQPQSLDDPSFKHHRRRSDFRSKSTDQIIPAVVNNSSNPLISSTTLYPASNASTSKFSNVNVSQTVLRPAPLAPVPIPATRFDTITSYVDVIYQHQQQNANHHDDQSEPVLDLESQNTPNSSPDIVYLDPSDGIDGDQSFMATCPQCTMMVMTELQPFPGKKSKRMALILLPVLLCWMPYYLGPGKKWMDVKHFCPKCQSLIAIYRK